MELSTRDKMIMQLQDAIKENQDGVLSKISELNIIEKDNRFLRSVYTDYKKYHDYIIQEKKREQQQMKMLAQYLEKILLEANLTDSMAQRAILEQNRILGQLNEIKSELDKLVSM